MRWKNVMVALDIDGVILRGGRLIPQANVAIQQLKQLSIPFVFMSNGGGCTEFQKAQELSKKLDVSIDPDQIILCHTPLQQFADKYSNEQVLVLGNENCLDVAKQYGFNKAISSMSIWKNNPTVYPALKHHDEKTATHSHSHSHSHSHHETYIDDVQAIFAFHDPVNWGLDVQISLDILFGKQLLHHRSRKHQDNPLKQRVPFFSTNSDMVYMNEQPLPRFTQGAFVHTLESLAMKHMKSTLTINRFGKPFPVQFEFAEKKLLQQAELLSRTHCHHQQTTSLPKEISFVMIGDNPESDVAGAIEMGKRWQSILVTTGVYQGGVHSNDAHFPANHVVHSIHDAIELIVKG